MTTSAFQEYLTLTTELQAVNLCLRAIGESPINSLASEDMDSSALSAVASIGEASRDVQEEGWAFNRDEGFVISPDVDGYIVLPSNLLKFKQAWFNGGWNKNLVQRANRIYDRKNQTFIFTEDVTVDITTILAFTDLPQAARTYIALEGANRLVAAKLVSTTASRLIGSFLAPARIRLEQEEADADQSTLADNPHVNRTRRRRR